MTDRKAILSRYNTMTILLIRWSKAYITVWFDNWCEYPRQWVSSLPQQQACVL